MNISPIKSVSVYGDCRDISAAQRDAMEKAQKNLQREIQLEQYDKLAKEGKIFRVTDHYGNFNVSTIPVSKDMKMIGIQFTSGGLAGLISPELKNWSKRTPFRGTLAIEPPVGMRDGQTLIVHLFDVSSPLNKEGEKFAIQFEQKRGGKTEKIDLQY